MRLRNILKRLNLQPDPPVHPAFEDELGDGGPPRSLLAVQILPHLDHIERLATLSPGEIVTTQELDEICTVVDRIHRILGGR